jgi:hypothetical protein
VACQTIRYKYAELALTLWGTDHRHSIQLEINRCTWTRLLDIHEVYAAAANLEVARGAAVETDPCQL